MRRGQNAAAADPHGAGLKVAVIAGVIVLAVTALVFSSSFTTRDVAEDGVIALQSESALGANDVAFKALGQVVLLAEDRALGVADDAVVAKAEAEVTAALDDLAARIESLSAVDSDSADELAGPLNEVLAAGAAVLAAVEASDEPSRALAEVAKPAFESLRDALATERTGHAESLTAAGDLASRMGFISQFLVAFLLPLAAIVAYRFTARRQLRLAEVQLDAQLEAEHEVHRAKDEFIANMSHELRTPLTSIYGFSEVLIETGLVDPDSAIDLITMINTESAELGRMVEDLLVSARAAADALAYTYRPVDLAEEAAVVIAPLVRSGAQVEVDLPTTPVWADPLRARQLLRNLVSNAIRHGGERVMVTGSVSDDRLSVAVMDDGPGVPEEMVPRLFTRFVHDGDEALTVGSVGLGLAVVRELATAMGGDVGYQRRGSWTIFEFWLPIADEVELGYAPPVAIPTVPAAPEPPPPLTARRDAG